MLPAMINHHGAMDQMASDRLVSRRSLFHIGAAAALALSPVSAFAGATRTAPGRPVVPRRGVRSLSFANLHTGAKLKMVSWKDGKRSEERRAGKDWVSTGESRWP